MLFLVKTFDVSGSLLNVKFPEVAFSKPPISFPNVVLPLPFEPISPITSPVFASNETPESISSLFFLYEKCMLSAFSKLFYESSTFCTGSNFISSRLIALSFFSASCSSERDFISSAEKHFEILPLSISTNSSAISLR